MASNVSANLGAADALSRWCSHSRHITHSNNLFGAIGLHHLMSFAAGLHSTVVEFGLLLNGNNFLAYIAYVALYTVICVYYAILVVLLVLNEFAQVLERSVCLCFHIFTFFFFNYSRMNSIYGTAMNIVESVLGKLWHDSTIVLTTPQNLCRSCKAGSCREGSCYILTRGILLDQARINCACFKKHVTKRLDLARERDACKTMFVQSGLITECKYLWRPSLIAHITSAGCGVYDDSVLERYYDMDRSMWASVRLESVSQKQYDDMHNCPSFQRSRNDLDEVVRVPMSNPDPLFEMPELRYSFLRDRSRIISGCEIIYTPIVLLKRFALFLLAVFNVRYAAKQWQDEKELAIVIVCSTIFYYALQGLRDRVTLDDIGGADSRVARMLCIDNLSVGKNLVRYSSTDTSWTRHRGFGSVSVGSITVLQNVLFARGIVVGKMMVSFSREGTEVFFAGAQKKSNGNVIGASKWSKADFDDVAAASMKEVADFEHILC